MLKYFPESSKSTLLQRIKHREVKRRLNHILFASVKKKNWKMWFDNYRTFIYYLLIREKAIFKIKLMLGNASNLSRFI